MTKTMLLIDADNLSVDVIGQAVAHLLAEHGALHVRRAYCTAEAAVKHQAAFKRLGIRPMVNLAAGKNSTDIAMAVDAIDLVRSERPDLVAIASSDSDFAPLVSRLREKGCRVIGLGQEGKVGEATQAVYDEFVVLEHGRGRGRAVVHKAAAAPPAPEVKTAAPAIAALEAAPEKPVKTAGSAAAAGAAKTTRSARVTKPGRTAATPAPAARKSRRAAAPRTAAGAKAEPALPDKLREILAHLPELRRGESLELRFVSARLREAGLLSKSGSSTKLLAPFKEHLELLPTGAPNHVRWLGAS